MKTKIKDFISRHDTLLLCIFLAVLFILATSIPVHAYSDYSNSGTFSSSVLNSSHYYAYGSQVSLNHGGFIILDLGTNSSRTLLGDAFGTSAGKYVIKTGSDTFYPILYIIDESNSYASWDSSSTYSYAKFSSAYDYGYYYLNNYTFSCTGGASSSDVMTAYNTWYSNFAPTLSSITASKTQTYYYLNDTVSYDDITVTATWSDGTTTTPGTWVHSNVDTSTSGSKQLMITYEGKTATIDITVANPTTSSFGHYVACVNSDSYFVYRFRGTNQFAIAADYGFHVDTDYDFYYDSLPFLDYQQIPMDFIYHSASGYTVDNMCYIYQNDNADDFWDNYLELGSSGIYDHFDYYPCILQKEGTNYLVLNSQSTVDNNSMSIHGDTYIYTFTNTNNRFHITEAYHYPDANFLFYDLGYRLLNDSSFDSENDTIGISSHVHYMILHPTYVYSGGGGSTEPGTTDPGTTEVNVDMSGVEARVDRMLLLFGLCIVWFVGSGISKKVGDF